MNAQLEQIQKDIAQITATMAERAKRDQEVDVLALAEKLKGVQKELDDTRKIQFGTSGSPSTMAKKELETRMDELFIAKMLCTDVDTKAFDRAKFAKITENPVYAEAIKTAATFDGVDGMSTTGTATGAEFIPKGFSSTLQEEIWLALEVANLFGRINMPFSDYTLPFNPGRIIVKAGGEGTSVTKVKAATANLNFKAQKIMSIVEMTDEFEQDSLVPALNFLRKQLIDGFALGQETMSLNGDKAHYIYSMSLSGSPEDVRKLVHGIRADAFKVGSTLDSQAAALTAKGFGEESLRALRAKLGKYGKAPGDLAYIVGIQDYFKMLSFTNFLTLNLYGANATILRGELGRFDNIPIIVSELLPGATVATDAADALGGINASGIWDNVTKTKTCSVIVNKNAYMWGDRKEFSLELWRNPLSQTTNLIGSQRLDFEKVLAATDPTCGVLYNY